MNLIESKVGQDLIQGFIEKYKPSSAKVYLSDITQFFKYYDRNVFDLCEKEIISYIDSLDISQKSITRKVSILSKFFIYIEKHLEGFKSPISKTYGSQTKYQGAYKTTERFQKDMNNWLNLLNVRKNTKQTYKVRVRQFFDWFENSPKNLTHDVLQTYKQFMEQQHELSTIWLRFVSMNSFLKYIFGEKSKEILSFKKLNIIPPKKDKGYYHVLQENEISTLMAQPDQNTLIGLRDYAILRMMCTYGLRANEICRLSYGDFEPYRVENQQKIWIRDRKGKANNRAETAIILNGKVLAAMDNWINNASIDHTNTTPIFNQFKWNIRDECIELDMERIDNQQPLTVRTIENIIAGYMLQMNQA